METGVELEAFERNIRADDVKSPELALRNAALLDSPQRLKPHLCVSCNKSFTLKSSLKRHQKKHATSTDEQTIQIGEEQPKSLSEPKKSVSEVEVVVTESQPRAKRQAHGKARKLVALIAKSDGDLRGDDDDDNDDDFNEMEHTNDWPSSRRKRRIVGKDVKTRRVIKHKTSIRAEKNKVLSCDICAKTFTSANELTVHSASHKHSEFDRKELTRSEESTQKEHCNSLHQDGVRCAQGTQSGDKTAFRCGICGKFFSRRFVLFCHKRTHTGEKPYECARCGARFRWSLQLALHVADHPEEKCYKCRFCNKHFLTGKELQKHSRTHPEKKRAVIVVHESASDPIRKLVSEVKKKKKNHHECSVCGKKFHNFHYLQGHWRRLHQGEKPHECGCCGMKFTWHMQLSIHAKKHPSGKAFKCQVCSESFCTLAELGAHKKKHPRYKVHNCAVCGEMFRLLRDLLTHSKKHSREKCFRCESCDECFELQNEKQKHKCVDDARDAFVNTNKKLVDVREPVKRYHCDRCSVCVSRTELLAQHLQLHVNPKPFQCESCGKCFGRADNLRNHSRIHTGCKPFCCETCGKCFRESGQLVKHRRTHTGEKPFVCKVCGRGFTDSSKVKKHCESIHSESKRGKNNFTKTQKIKTPKKKKTHILIDKPSVQTNNVPLQSHKHVADVNLTQYSKIPFECGVCSEQFYESDHVMAHMKTHTGEWSYEYVPVASAPGALQPLTSQQHSVAPSERCVAPSGIQLTSSCYEMPQLAVANSMNNVTVHFITDADNVLRDMNYGTPYVQNFHPYASTSRIGMDFFGNANFEYTHNSQQANVAVSSISEPAVATVTTPAFLASKATQPQDDVPNLHVLLTLKKAELIEPSPCIMSVPAQLGSQPAAHFIPDSTADVIRSTTNETAARTPPSSTHSKTRVTKRRTNRTGTRMNTASPKVEQEKLTKPAPVKPVSKRKAFYDVYQENNSEGWTSEQGDLPEGVKPLDCNLCGKRFRLMKFLKRHMRSHTGERPYACKKCDQKFAQYIKLVKHSLTHDEVEKRCDICDKPFNDHEKLLKHARYHVTQKSLKCQFCGLRYSQKTSLATHLKTHSGEKPFQCESCGKCFAQLSNYKAHSRIHADLKPFGPCEFCGKFFREQGQLKKHRRIHTGERPYVCEICGKGFTDSSKVKKHVRSVHLK